MDKSSIVYLRKYIGPGTKSSTKEAAGSDDNVMESPKVADTAHGSSSQMPNSWSMDSGFFTRIFTFELFAIWMRRHLETKRPSELMIGGLLVIGGLAFQSRRKTAYYINSDVFFSCLIRHLSANLLDVLCGSNHSKVLHLKSFPITSNQDDPRLFG